MRRDGLPSDLHDVPAFLSAVSRRRPLTTGKQLLVVTDMDHNVLNVRSLGTRKATYDKRSRIAYDVIAPMLNEMSPPRAATGSPVSVAYVVRPRAGRAVITDEDHEWRYTLLWGCGISPCFTGDVVIVTPHGWRYDEQGGWEPRLADPSRPPLRAVG